MPPPAADRKIRTAQRRLREATSRLRARLFEAQAATCDGATGRMFVTEDAGLLVPYKNYARITCRCSAEVRNWSACVDDKPRIECDKPDWDVLKCERLPFAQKASLELLDDSIADAIRQYIKLNAKQVLQESELLTTEFSHEECHEFRLYDVQFDPIYVWIQLPVKAASVAVSDLGNDALPASEIAEHTLLDLTFCDL